MHDDDWFSGPESLQVFADSGPEREQQVLFFCLTNVYPDGRLKRYQSESLQTVNRLKKTPEILLAANLIGPPSVVIFKKDDSIYFDNRMQWLVDIDFYIRYLKNHSPCRYIPDSLFRSALAKARLPGQVLETRK